MNVKERYYEIDLFRFIAALGVVLFHYTFRGYAADEMSILAFPTLGVFFKYGFLGVDFFFMISGFVVLLSALERNLAGFLISRITRLYPAFWVAVSVTAIVTVIIGGSRYNVGFTQYLANLSMVSGYFGIKAVDGVYWTLLIELKFYFLISVLLFFKQMKNIEFYLFLWLLISVLSIYIKLPVVVEYFLFTRWSSYFIAGAFFYLLRKNGSSLLCLVGIVLSYFISITYAYWSTSSLYRQYGTEFSPLIISGIVSILYILMFLVSIKKTEVLNKRVMLSFGMLTYPLYLIHQNVGYMLFNHFGNDNNKFALLGITTFLMLFLAYIFSKYFEKNIALKLKRILLVRLVI